jgi:hypothetical protein
VAATVLGGALLTAPALTLAQDDDLDALMEADRELEPGERHESAEQEPEALEEEEDSFYGPDDYEPPPEGWDGSSKDDEQKDDAPAEEADDDEVAAPLSFALLVGYGISFEEENPWGFGFGLRGGYNLGNFFVGGRLVYSLGETATRTTTGVLGGSSSEEVSVSLWELGGEVGFDIHVGSVTLRPGLGIGFANVTDGDSSEVYAHLSPGLSILLAVGDTTFIGLDARFQAVMTELGTNGMPILATVGMAF